jgi:four helix bundle protein
MAGTLEELPIYEKIVEFWHAVNDTLSTPALRRNGYLHRQIERANGSIESNMREGFEQPTDQSFAKFVFIAKGSVAEVITRMQEARRKNQITEDQLTQIVKLGVPLGKMMGGFIKYLAASGFTDRGRHSVSPTPPRDSSR